MTKKYLKSRCWAKREKRNFTFRKEMKTFLRCYVDRASFLIKAERTKEFEYDLHMELRLTLLLSNLLTK